MRWAERRRKNRTIRMLVGLVRPTSGRIAVGGHDLATEREGR